MRAKSVLTAGAGALAAAVVLFAACGKSSTSSGAAVSSGSVVPTTGTGTPADAAAAVNEQIASEGTSATVAGLVPAALLPTQTISASVGCTGGGTAALSGSWVNIHNSSSAATGDWNRVWQVNVTHTLVNCKRRGYTINGSFDQVLDTTNGSTYMFRTREVASPNMLYSSTGTYALSGTGITVTGNNLSTSTIHSCAVSGDVTFDREDTTASTTLTASGSVTFCGNTYGISIDKSVVATGL